MDRPLAAFDIESIPDPAIGRSLYALPGGDEVIIEGMLRRRMAESEGTSDFHLPPYHRIVALCVAWLDPASGSFKLGSPAGDSMDERQILESFFALLERPRGGPRLVSWNGNGFDIPVLHYRGMLHGVRAPGFHRSEGEWKYNNYHGRYHDMHVDLMDVLAGYGASGRMGLDDLSRIMGLPGKTVTEGHRVFRHVLRGEIELVRTYCELDALNTLLLYLLWAFHRGRLDSPTLRAHRDTIAATLRAAEGKPAWREYADAIAAWPVWLSPPAEPSLVPPAD